jgi:broad specificity phosphatase PhoE
MAHEGVYPTPPHPRGHVSIEITFVRHGETEANAASIWQGQGDAALSDRGRAQARSLADRLDPGDFDLVVSSDLVRTLETADLAGLDPVSDAGFREMDIGAWEGLTRQQVHDRFPDELARMAAGDRDVPMGGGESWTAFSKRIEAAIDRVVERVDPGSRVLVIAHGGVIHSALATRLEFRAARPWPIARILNAAITELIVDDGWAHLQVLNDVRHVPEVTGHEEDRSVPVALVRHGESVGNVEGRWHGHTDGPLTDRGVEQARRLAEQYDGATRVFASPLERTRRTAIEFARQHDLDVELDRGLIEQHFGAWEGLTTSEISSTFADEWEEVFGQGVDLPRGGTGETFEQAGARVAGAVARIVERHPTERLALFTHGGAIWAFASKIVGIDWSGWRALAIPGNTSVTHVRYDGGAPVLVDYNLPLL